MTPRRLTPIYADGPAPPAKRPKRRALQIARMEMPVIGLLYAVLCGRWLLAENLKSNGLNPLHWHRSAVHVPEAVGQAAQLTIILLGFDLFLRMGKARKAVK